MGVSVRFRELTEQDLPAVLEIRNHEDTLKWLHTQEAYTIEQAVEWFRTDRPEWLAIEDGDSGEFVGYVRTGHKDVVNRTMSIGMDIAPSARGKGHVWKAYKALREIGRDMGLQAFTGRVLHENVRALKVDKHVGFYETDTTDIDVGVRLDVSDPIPRHTGRSAKVIACWAGTRREPPKTIADYLNVLKCTCAKELTLDQGMPVDTLLVHNYPLANDPILDDAAFKANMDFLYSMHGQETPNGRIYVLERPNIGISFGAYDHAFRTLHHAYDSWFFVEDDCIQLADNVFKIALETMIRIGGQQIGFVGMCGGIGHPGAPHCSGGVGVTTREILYKVREQTIAEDLQYPILPHWRITDRRGVSAHEGMSEVPFTNMIHRLGYRLVEYPEKEAMLEWQRIGTRGAGPIKVNSQEVRDELLSECLGILEDNK